MYDREYLPELFRGNLKENEREVIAGNVASDYNDTLSKDFVHHYGGYNSWIIGKVGLDGWQYVLPLTRGGIDALKPHVDEFIEFASKHKELRFLVTGIGHGFVGFGIKRVAPLFKKAIDVENIYMLKSFVDAIEGNPSPNRSRKGIKYLK
jgi:hypothetical protein